MRLLYVLFLILLSACSHTYFAHDKTNPHYYSGGSYFYPIAIWNMVGRDNDKSENTKPTYRPANDTKHEAENAAVGVIASGLSLLVNKDYYASPYISGTCLCSSVQDSVIELPCSDLIVKLLDAGGREIQTIHTQDGEFIFPVETQKEYSVRIESQLYQVKSAIKSPLFLGDKIVVHLSPVNPRLMLAQ